MPAEQTIGSGIEMIKNLPDGVRAELIDGVIYDQADPNRVHQRIVLNISVKLSNYISKNKGNCEVNVAPFAVYLNDETDYLEPDVFVVCNKDKMKNDGCYGAPDFIVEVVSPTSRVRDLFIKLNKYRMAGVREYWIVDPEKEKVLVYHFEKNDFPDTYDFEDEIPVGIYGDLYVRIAEMLA